MLFCLKLWVGLKLWVEFYKLCFVNEDSLIISENYFNVRNIFSWLSTGVIDAIKTVCVFIRNEILNTQHRFLFACEYYFEQDAKRLWMKMSKRDRLQIRVKLRNDEDKRHWLRALENRTAPD
ncbi:hypothetical protein NPIL_196741 [Nephila pilipes]|uniref:Uncharacterized protein n=1 Tax=Nephila pilipes TaxID=299642 RepID=A0A8X6U571_NEPPI|nr:hypothetical protein NPIL_678331 [Nephila pilipes]GFU31161.1 hypothetical protein NPIL_196741 [Nephila pilipes]